MDRRSIRALNNKFLRHDYVTDVISFDLSSQSVLEGEIYICFDQAVDQAKVYKVPVSNELLRLVAHGMLHILGYNDRSQKDRSAMLKLGDRYISKLK
jgi:rRNA maturation RNase YbeY